MASSSSASPPSPRSRSAGVFPMDTVFPCMTSLPLPLSNVPGVLDAPGVDGGTASFEGSVPGSRGGRTYLLYAGRRWKRERRS